MKTKIIFLDNPNSFNSRVEDLDMNLNQLLNEINDQFERGVARNRVDGLMELRRDLQWIKESFLWKKVISHVAEAASQSEAA